MEDISIASSATKAGERGEQELVTLSKEQSEEREGAGHKASVKGVSPAQFCRGSHGVTLGRRNLYCRISTATSCTPPLLDVARTRLGTEAKFVRRKRKSP